MYVDLKKLFSGEDKELVFQNTTFFEKEALSNGSVFAEPVEVRLSLEKEGNSTVKIDISGRAIFEGVCARCLKEFTFSQHINSTIYLSEENLKNDSDEFPIEGTWLNADEMILQEIILQAPLVLHCSVDCTGLCGNCGTPKELGCDCAPLTGDPRLQILKELL